MKRLLTSAALFAVAVLTTGLSAADNIADAKKLFSTAFAALEKGDVAGLAATYPQGEWAEGIGGEAIASGLIRQNAMTQLVAQASEKFGAEALKTAAQGTMLGFVLGTPPFRAEEALSGEFSEVAPGRVQVKISWQITEKHKRSKEWRAFERDGTWFMYDRTMDRPDFAERYRQSVNMADKMLVAMQGALPKAATADEFITALKPQLDEIRAAMQAAFQPKESKLTFSLDENNADRYRLALTIAQGNVDKAAKVSYEQVIKLADGSSVAEEKEEFEYKAGRPRLKSRQLQLAEVPDVEKAVAMVTISWLDAEGNVLTTTKLETPFDVESLTRPEKIWP